MNLPADFANPRSRDLASRLENRLPTLADAYRRSRPGRQVPERASHAGLSPSEISLLGDALRELQRGLTSERRLAGRSGGFGYMDRPDLLGAYLMYYWPVSYLEISLSLAYLPQGGAPIRRVLDLGAGPGPASAAFADSLGATDFVLVDGSEGALRLASGIMGGGYGMRTVTCDLEKDLPEDLGSFDAIVASHLLNELWKERPDRIERRLAFLRAQAARLGPQGFVLAVEPATQTASRDLIRLRDALVAEGWNILAPCPSTAASCPILAAGPDRNCHAEAAWAPPPQIAQLAARAGLDRASVKWTFFLAQAPTPSRFRAARDVTREAAPGAVRHEPRGKGELCTIAGRVVSAGMLNKAGRLRYAVCTENGLVTLSAKADSTVSKASGFERLGRYDRLELEGGEVREGGIGLVDASVLRIEPAPRIEAEPPLIPDQGRKNI